MELHSVGWPGVSSTAYECELCSSPWYYPIRTAGKLMIIASLLFVLNIRFME